jgi:hypothetical protein
MPKSAKSEKSLMLCAKCHDTKKSGPFRGRSPMQQTGHHIQK